MSKPDYDTDHEVLWTGKDVAKVCRTTPEMVARWRQESRGPKYIVVAGHSIRYRRSDVMFWLDQHTVTTSESA